LGKKAISEKKRDGGKRKKKVCARWLKCNCRRIILDGIK